MKKLRIRACLKNGFVASNDFTPAIDAIIAYAQTYERLGHDEFVETQASNQLKTHDDLPILKTDCEDWQYQCSLPIYTVKKKFTTHIHRRFNVEEAIDLLEKVPSKIEVTKGGLRNARLSVTVTLTDFIDWYLIGDKDEIERLLNLGFTNSIGRRRGVGFGKVEKWEVTEVNEIEYYLERYMISLIDNGGVEIDWAIRPPAQLQENKRHCWINSGVSYE